MNEVQSAPVMKPFADDVFTICYRITTPAGGTMGDALAVCPSKIGSLVMTDDGSFRCVELNIEPIKSWDAISRWVVLAKFAPAGICNA